MTGFAHMHLPLVSDYLQVQQCMTGVTCDLSAITREQCTSHVAQAQHMSYL